VYIGALPATLNPAYFPGLAVHRFINILRRSSTMAKVLAETLPHLD
jgi:hypothetical protein